MRLPPAAAVPPGQLFAPKTLVLVSRLDHVEVFRVRRTAGAAGRLWGPASGAAIASVVLAEQPGAHLHHPRGGPECGLGERSRQPAHLHHPPGWGLAGGSGGSRCAPAAVGPPGLWPWGWGLVGTWTPAGAEHGPRLWTLLHLSAAVTCHLSLALPAGLRVPCLAWLSTWHLSVPLSSRSLGVPSLDVGVCSFVHAPACGCV